MVTTHKALFVANYINDRLSRYFVALGGSTLKGPGNDVDLVVLPHSLDDYDPADLREQLREAGLRLRYDCPQVHRDWRKKGSTDTKVVEVWEIGTVKVDLFFPYESAE
jgi:hypothetical protein